MYWCSCAVCVTQEIQGPVPVIVCLEGSYIIHFDGTAVPEPPVSSFQKALEVGSAYSGYSQSATPHN